MKSKNLIALGRRKALSSQFDWLEQKRLALEKASGEGDLLEMTYPEWCKTLDIKTPEGLQPFSLYDWQLDTAIKLLGADSRTPTKGRQIVLLSSRQTGKTSMLLTMTDYMARSRRQLTAIMIHRTGDDAHDLCRRLKRFTGVSDFKTDNLSLLEYKPTGSVLYFRSGNPNRGEEGAIRAGQGISSADWIVIEESQDFANIKSVIGMVGPAATHGNPKLTILVGTAGSKQSYFYQQLSEAAGSSEKLEAVLSGIRAGTEKPFQILDSGKGPIAIISNWRCIPEFAAEPDFLARIQSELGLSDEDVSKHYEMVFDSAITSSVYDFNLVMSAQAEDIEPHREYDVTFAGCDPAGMGKDFAVLVTIRKRTEGQKQIYEVIDIYRKQSGVSEQHLNAIAQRIEKLKPLCVTIEKNSMGQVWLENLAGLGFAGTQIEGFSTTSASKPVLIGRLQIALERGVLRIPKGSIIVEELLAYRRTDSGKLEAGGKAHDDCVIALSLALFSSGFNQ